MSTRTQILAALERAEAATAMVEQAALTGDAELVQRAEVQLQAARALLRAARGARAHTALATFTTAGEQLRGILESSDDASSDAPAGAAGGADGRPIALPHSPVGQNSESARPNGSCGVARGSGGGRGVSAAGKPAVE